MGVFPAGYDPNRVQMDLIAEQMRPAVATMFNARVVFFTTKASEPLYDTGENGCMIDVLRSPTPIDFGGQATYIQGIRIQTGRPAALEVLPPGVRVKVKNGGEADELEHLFFTVSEGVDSSYAWGHIITATLLPSVMH